MARLGAWMALALLTLYLVFIGGGWQGIYELVGRTIEGGLASFYGTYTYRRPTPWDLLVPSLIHFTVK
jgi:hypothetical protein